MHRDIKPSNLFRLPNVSTKLLDFGLARADDETGQAVVGMGTLDYMAPEQVRAACVADARSDLFSVWTTLYFLCSGGSLRLPTEAEWEYACRAGTSASRYGNLDDIAWYDVNSARRSQDVGGLCANPLGLHDMLGNVWEWCSDWYGAYSSEAQVNPQGPNKGQSRVYRGGAWDVNFRRCRATRRDHYASNVTRNSIGFRVARTT